MRLLLLASSVWFSCGGDDGPTPENTLERCSDGADNDGDGFVDCDDQNCELFSRCVGGDADADTDSDGDVDCPTYCIREGNCDSSVDLAACVDGCECEAQYLYRADAGASYFACIEGQACSATDPEGACAEVIAETLEGTSGGAAWLAACGDRRARACGRLACERALLYTDPVLDALTPCLDSDSCDAVLACIAQVAADAC